VYERDLGRVRVGQRVEAVVDAFPGQTFPGLIAFIHPHLDDSARAGVVRINVSNEELRLREGMFAAARIQTDPGPEGPLVPREAVIDTGQRQIVFVALGEGRFEPRQVSLGEDGEDGRVRVLQGLSAGERVVVSGHFLLDSESRLREAVRKYASGDAAKSPPPQSAPQQARPSGVAPTPPAPGVPMPVAPPAASALLVSIDAVYSTYLQMAAALGKVQETDTPLDPAALVVAARAMQVAAVTPQDRALASGVLAAAQALSGQKIREQRQRFKALGGAMLALAEARPPSARVAPKLYCMHCPMAPGDWLQTTDAVANPFYPDAMKECGEVVREIPARAEGDAPR
jgi:hypothetical protein